MNYRNKPKPSISFDFKISTTFQKDTVLTPKEPLYSALQALWLTFPLISGSSSTRGSRTIYPANQQNACAGTAPVAMPQSFMLSGNLFSGFTETVFRKRNNARIVVTVYKAYRRWVLLAANVILCPPQCKVSSTPFCNL